MDQHVAVRCLSFPRAGMGCEIELSHMNYLTWVKTTEIPIWCARKVYPNLSHGEVYRQIYNLKFSFTAIRERSCKT